MNETSGLRVSVDVGCYQHSVAFGLSDGTLLAEFELSHEPAGFDRFFERIDRLRERHVSGQTRPLLTDVIDI